MSAPYYSDESVTVHHGDCLDVLRTLPDASVDAVVTDPPYGLEFMGKDWDAPWKSDRRQTWDDNFTPAKDATTPFGKIRHGMGASYGADARAGRAFGDWCEAWSRECLRVLKPGGHMLAFGGSRTWHRLACAVEDAGFEIRDSVAWIYGSGFPKSLNVSKSDAFCQCGKVESERGESPTEHDVRAVHGADVPAPGRTVGGSGAVLLEGLSEPSASTDGALSAARGEGRAERLVAGRRDAQAPARELLGSAVRAVPAGVPGDGPRGRVRDGAPASDGPVDRPAAAAIGSGEPSGPRPVEQLADEPRALPVERGSQARRGRPVCGGCGKPQVAPGLGTALKPAFEPIVVARKPLTGTVAANVLAHGTGALNIDATRTATSERLHGTGQPPLSHGGTNARPFHAEHVATASQQHDAGRWPTNVVLDESQAAELDEQTGVLTSGKMRPTHTTAARAVYGQNAEGGFTTMETYGDSGGASRFFPTFRYEAKAPTAERPRAGEIAHPTVKPLDLMRWLVRLVTPPGGTVLEPFAGSGTTAEACVVEGFRCIAIEREADYLPLITSRIAEVQPVLDLGGIA